MNIFLCFCISLKFSGRHPRSPCSNTSVSQPQNLPVYCLVRIICSKSWVQYISLLLWINLNPTAKCISILPQKCFPFSPQLFLCMKSECILYSSGSSLQPVAQMELISAASTSPAATWQEIPDISVAHDQTLRCMCAVSLRLSKNCWISLKGFGNTLKKGKNLNPSFITPLLSLYCGYLSARSFMHFA